MGQLPSPDARHRALASAGAAAAGLVSPAFYGIRSEQLMLEELHDNLQPAVSLAFEAEPG